MRNSLYAVLFFSLAGILGAAQISVGPNVQVSRSHPGDAHYEVTAAVDPQNPSRMLASSFLYPQDGSEGQTVVYASADRGKSWKPVLEGKPMENTSDPALAFGPGGIAYYVVAHVPAVGLRTMRLYRSRNGENWEPHDTLTYTDREYVAVDNTGGRYNGNLYINGNNRIPPGVSDIVLFSSTDQGRHFAGPVKRAGFGKFKAEEMGNAVVTSDGTMIAIFVQAGEGAASTLCATSSIDGGASLTDAVAISDYFAGGNRKGSHNNVNSLPALAIDSSHGPFRERLYAVWPDRRSGHSQIYFSFSADKGKTWSKARAINDNPADDLTDQSMPEVAVNREGVVGVIWSDRRNHPDNLGWDIRFTASTDGGKTFEPSVQVSQGGTSFDKAFQATVRPAVARAAAKAGDGSGLSLQLSLSNFLFIGGDTWGLVADAVGMFHAFWSDNRTGAAQLWTAAVEVGAGVATAGKTGAVVPAPPLREIKTDKMGVPPRDLVDRSKLLTLELTHPVFDRERGTLSADAQVVNLSDQKIRGPFAVRITAVSSQLADVAAESEVWSFEDVELAPGAGSGSKHVRFRLANFRPFRDGDRYRLGILNLTVQVLGAQ